MPGGVARRRSLLQEGETERAERLEREREKARSENWSRLGYNRTPEAAYRSMNVNMNMAGAPSDPNSSPTSSAPARTRLSSSNSATLVSSTTGAITPSNAEVNANNAAANAALTLLKERHELEKEALLNALAETKRTAALERQESEAVKVEVRELGIYVEELEEKLAEALARIRWMDGEMMNLREIARAGKVSYYYSPFSC
jgi:hypothetical protein